MRSVVSWIVDNPVAAKLMMLIIVVAGVMTFPLLDKQFFPQTEIDLIRVSVDYPGAGPAEVEKQICARIEEAVQDLAGIEEIRATAREGYGEVVIEVRPEVDTQRLLNDVKANVDAINTFPSQSERPQIVELRWKNTMMRLQLAGDIGERELKELGEQIREELTALPWVALVELHTPRSYEVGIEVSELALKNYQLDFDEVAQAIRGYSLNLPGGKIRAAGGDIALQTRAQADIAIDFSQIPLRSNADGSVLRVGDVATIVDGFEDDDVYSAVNGMPSLELWIRNESRPQILRTSEVVRDYVERKSRELPDSVQLSIWADSSISYQGRLDTLIYNGSGGLLLVFAVLVVFLRPSLAFWVCSGIAVAFLGAIWTLSLTPISLNIISMFAFIMILGIVVDDAIIVGESVFSYQQRLQSQREGAIAGTLNVMAPVWFAVVSTMVFFTPFFFIGDGPEPGNLATPVMLALIFSLFESLLLLPSHLGNGSASGASLAGGMLQRYAPALHRSLGALEQRRERVAATLPAFAHSHYRNFLLRALSNRRLTLVVFGFTFSFAVATVQGGWLPFSFFPRVSSDYISARATLPESASFVQNREVLGALERAAGALRDDINNEYGYAMLKDIHATTYGQTARVSILLEDGNDRPLSAQALARQWQEVIGELPGVKELAVNFTIFELPKPMEFVLRSESQAELEAFSDALLQALKGIDGAFNVGSSLENPSNEINLVLRPEADSLSVTLRDVSTAVRQAFYGEEVQRIPRLREDVRVLVRYPRDERGFEESLRDMYVANPVAGQQDVPLTKLVDLEYRPAYKKVERLDRKRVARVSADVQRGFAPAAIIAQVRQDHLPALQQAYPSVDVSLDGEQQENEEFLREVLLYLVISMLGIFALMAIMFRSYWQPVLVLTAVPFGFMGAIFGHVIAGVGLSMFSILGMMACAGVVVNDNVVMIDRINQLRAAGNSARRAVVDGAVQRFRPIVLTSVTTFLGLTPILLEGSVQAQFLKPMVASLSFGVLFATFVTLLFVPALYLTGESVTRRLRNLRAALLPATESAPGR